MRIYWAGSLLGTAIGLLLVAILTELVTGDWVLAGEPMLITFAMMVLWGMLLELVQHVKDRHERRGRNS